MCLPGPLSQPPVFSSSPWCCLTSLGQRVFENGLMFFFSSLLALHWEIFSFEVSLFSKGARAGGGRGLDYPLAWLLNGVIWLHSRGEDSVAAVGRHSNEMKDRQHLLSLVTVQPDAGSHSWQPSRWICEKLSGCTLNQSVAPLKAQAHLSCQSALGSGPEVFEEAFIVAVQPLSQADHFSAAVGLTSNPICYRLQRTGPQMNT